MNNFPKLPEPVEKVRKMFNPKEFLEDLKDKMQSSFDIDKLYAPFNSELDSIMNEAQRQGKWTDVCNVLGKVERLCNKYQTNVERNPFLWRLFYLTPSRFISQIKGKFEQEKITKSFFKTLDYDITEVKIYNVFLGIVLFLWVGIILVVWHLIFQIFNWWNILIVIAILIFGFWILSILDSFYQYVIRDIVFTQVFEKFKNAFEYRENRRLKLIQDTLDLPEKLEEQWQQYHLVTFGDQLDEERQETLKRLRLEAEYSLQELAAIVARNQAISEREVAMIRNETALRDLEARLRIVDPYQAKERKQQLALHSINGLQQVLVAMGGFLAENNLKDKDLQRILALTNGMKSKARENPDLSDPIFQDFQDFLDRFTNGFVDVE